MNLFCALCYETPPCLEQQAGRRFLPFCFSGDVRRAFLRCLQLVNRNMRAVIFQRNDCVRTAGRRGYCKIPVDYDAGNELTIPAVTLSGGIQKRTFRSLHTDLTKHLNCCLHSAGHRTDRI